VDVMWLWIRASGGVYFHFWSRSSLCGAHIRIEQCVCSRISNLGVVCLTNLSVFYVDIPCSFIYHLRDRLCSSCGSNPDIYWGGARFVSPL